MQFQEDLSLSELCCFFYRSERTVIILKHLKHHLRAKATSSFSDSNRQCIEKLSQSGMSPHQLLSTMRSLEFHMIVYNDFYNFLLTKISGNFRRSSNPLISAKIVCGMRRPRYFCYYFQVMSFGLRFFNCVGADIVARYRIEEMFIDSTFRIIQIKVEVF